MPKGDTAPSPLLAAMFVELRLSSWVVEKPASWPVWSAEALVVVRFAITSVDSTAIWLVVKLAT